MFDASKGYAQARNEDVQWQLYCAREVAYWNVSLWSKDVKRADLMELEMDKKLKEQRIKNMKPATIVVDGDQQ